MKLQYSSQYRLRYPHIVRCQPVCSCSAKALLTSSLTQSGFLLTSGVGVFRVLSQDLIQEANNHWTGWTEGVGHDLAQHQVYQVVANVSCGHECQGM
jgi:hypothetical protein